VTIDDGDGGVIVGEGQAHRTLVSSSSSSSSSRRRRRRSRRLGSA